MGLFDNIFLDEDAVTAVVEKPTEAKAKEVAPVTETEKPETEEMAVMSTETNQTNPLSDTPALESATEEKVADSEISSAISPSPDTGVSFDIGGDLNFDSEMTNETEAIVTLDTGDAIKNEEESTNSSIQEDTATIAPVSFTVNGVAYNTNQAPESEESADATTSIAMIQGSTAASGINIIEDEKLGEGIIEEDNSLMNILTDESTTLESVTPETPIITEEASAEILPEPIITITDVQETDAETMIEEKIIDEETSLSLTEEVAHTEDTERVTATKTEHIQEQAEIVSPQSSELAFILDGFIQELGEREKAISTIIMKRHSLARRRMEVEEDHKTRMLAINMEDEFLKNKADRERAEQDRLQGVIKDFQKQIAATE